MSDYPKDPSDISSLMDEDSVNLQLLDLVHYYHGHLTLGVREVVKDDQLPDEDEFGIPKRLWTATGRFLNPSNGAEGLITFAQTLYKRDALSETITTDNDRILDNIIIHPDEIQEMLSVNVPHSGESVGTAQQPLPFAIKYDEFDGEWQCRVQK